MDGYECAGHACCQVFLWHTSIYTLIFNSAESCPSYQHSCSYTCQHTYPHMQIITWLHMLLSYIYSCLIQASSDMSVLDLDIPFALAFALSGVIDVTTTILVMATVTWQVLIVAVPIILAARYFQVKSLLHEHTLYSLFSFFYFPYKMCNLHNPILYYLIKRYTI